MTALYSRYRSQRFDDLVGQEAATRTLRNAVAGGRVSHAYLFTGIRGTGKTSTARILARAVNCEHPVDGEPDNACPACVAISDGSATDLIEIDAASNRGVDEMRDLRERARYLPSQLRFKVYIIDEAHQLTNEAFNALLKTLEEPPPHVLFILCTTEAHKLPATVVGRCQRFEFRRIGDADIAAHLDRIAAAEGLAHDAAGLATIAAMAHGSMRDAVSMLDQLASAGEERVDAEAVRRQLGLVPAAEVAGLLTLAFAGDRAASLRRLEALAGSGADLRQLAAALAEMARRAVLLSLGAATPADLALEPETAQALAAISGEPGRAWSAAAFEAALAAVAQLKQAHDPRLVLELLVLRMAGLTAAAPPSAIAAPAAVAPAPRASAAPTAPPQAAAAQPVAAPAPPRDADAEPAAAAPAAQPHDADARPAAAASTAPPQGADTQPTAPTSAAPAASPQAGDAQPAAPASAASAAPPQSTDAQPAASASATPVAPASLDEIVTAWPAVLAALRGPGAATRVRALLNDAFPIGFADEVLTVGFRFGFHSETAQAPANRQELERALQAAYGRAFRLAFRVDPELQVPRAAEPSAPPPLRAPDGAASAAPDDLPPLENPAVAMDAGDAAQRPAGAAPRAGGGGRAEALAQAAVELIGARVTDVRNKPRP